MLFEKYSDIIKKNTGYILTKTMAFEVKRTYDEIYKKEKDVE